jgi:hypothetical protein
MIKRIYFPLRKGPESYVVYSKARVQFPVTGYFVSQADFYDPPLA